MNIGSFYKVVPTKHICSECSYEKPPTLRAFPFGEEIGMFLGVMPSGFLRFKLSGKKEALMNGGSYEEVSVDMNLVAS